MRRKTGSQLLAVVALLAAGVRARGEPSGELPLPGPDAGVFAHDPTLLEGKDAWYLFFTGKNLQAARSTDGGRTWEPSRPVIADRPGWWDDAVPEHVNSDVWAPDAWTYRGRSWLAYAISTFGSNGSAIGLLSADAPAGPWRDEGLLVRSRSGDDFNAIDPELALDEKGAPWLLFGSFWSGIQLQRLDARSLHPVGARTKLASRLEGIEAPALLRHGGSFYLFVSLGRCCQGLASTYRIAVGRSKAITGPYLDRRGVDMRKGGAELVFDGDARWKGPGGQDVVGDGLVYHAYDARDGGRPKLRISALQWDADGWPRL